MSIDLYEKGRKVMKHIITMLQLQNGNSLASNFADEMVEAIKRLQKKHMIPYQLIGMKKYAEEYLYYVEAERLAGLLQKSIERTKLEGYDPDFICRALMECKR